MIQLCLNELIHQFRSKPSIHDPFGGALPIQQQSQFYTVGVFCEV